ncbi:hypothetical protein [Levilactobacillus lindianensis]|uniref:hypothetical protein n=1 Tax=Levilactobacillus lindianensis TaxID=2486018 RepID=UPI000F7425EF|nr:hypothetical protein [Levilactobacillus lindianensis]
MNDALFAQIIQRAHDMPSRETRGKLLPTSDYIDAQKFAARLNEAYPDARFEALRHDPIFLSIHKY